MLNWVPKLLSRSPLPSNKRSSSKDSGQFRNQWVGRSKPCGSHRQARVSGSITPVERKKSLTAFRYHKAERAFSIKAYLVPSCANAGRGRNDPKHTCASFHTVVLEVLQHTHFNMQNETTSVNSEHSLHKQALVDGVTLRGLQMPEIAIRCVCTNFPCNTIKRRRVQLQK